MIISGILGFLLRSKFLLAGGLFVVAGFGLYQYGKHVQGKEDARIENEALVQALGKVRLAEAKLSTEINGVSNDYEARISELKGRIDSANVELGRLRVKPRVSVPTIAATASESNAATTSEANGAGQGEVNLDGVAGKIIELGGDLDAANIKIIELQELVRKYADSCKLE